VSGQSLEVSDQSLEVCSRKIWRAFPFFRTFFVCVSTLGSRIARIVTTYLSVMCDSSRGYCLCLCTVDSQTNTQHTTHTQQHPARKTPPPPHHPPVNDRPTWSWSRPPFAMIGRIPSTQRLPVDSSGPKLSIDHRLVAGDGL